MGTLRRLYGMVKGFSEEEKQLLEIVQKVLNKEEFKKIKAELHEGVRVLSPGTLDLPEGVKLRYPTLTGTQSKEYNERFKQAAYTDGFSTFAPHAFTAISQAIAPGILEMQDIKEATCLQLFADEKLHILLLGDPGTGKTEVLRSSEHLAIKAAMGLGSGTSKAGLSVVYAKGELQKGLLLLADKGICCIDELNLMKKDDRAALYNAMEKGFVTYDKGGHHEQYSADVRVLATANPKGDRFIGNKPQELKKQLPFDPALLSRFHFVFLLRKPDVEKFVDIARKIGRGKNTTLRGEEFYKAYIRHANSLHVEFPPRLEPLITEAARSIKEKEDDLLIEVSPRIIKGIMGFAKASARCELRSEVNEEDVQRVLNILGSSLGMRL